MPDYNVAPIQVSNNDSTSATAYFNNFFDPTFTVPSNLDAAMISYFESVTGNKQSAKILASAVIYTAKTQGVKPMDILSQFKNLAPGEVNQYLVMFLNIQRVGTSFLGITTQPQTNKYVSRSILG
jgi:hypothetical protein